VDRTFTADGAWLHSHYCLEVELGQRSDARLLKAARALWTSPDMGVPVASRDQEPEQQAALSIPEYVSSRIAAWQERIEDWLVGLARYVYARFHFRFAVVGHELDTDAPRWWRWQREGLPADHGVGFLLPEDDGSLSWHPPTRRGGYVLCDPSASWPPSLIRKT
jgi:hypothetical protein